MKRHFNYPERSEWMRHALAVCVNCEYQLHTYMHWHMRSIGNRTIGSRCAHIATDEMADTCFSSGRHGATHVSKTIALIHWVSVCKSTRVRDWGRAGGKWQSQTSNWMLLNNNFVMMLKSARNCSDQWSAFNWIQWIAVQSCCSISGLIFSDCQWQSRPQMYMWTDKSINAATNAAVHCCTRNLGKHSQSMTLDISICHAFIKWNVNYRSMDSNCWSLRNQQSKVQFICMTQIIIVCGDKYRQITRITRDNRMQTTTTKNQQKKTSQRNQFEVLFFDSSASGN